MSSFTFRRAERETTSMLIALAGASGSGKTYTAICLALGLAYPDMTPEEIIAAIESEGRCRVVVLDSEGGRALHYAPKPGAKPDFKSSFPFEYGELAPPFTPQSYQDAVVSANEAGFAAVVVDSMSHEYESEGGVLEWADKLAAGVPKPGIQSPEAWKRDHWIEQPVKSPGNWKEPKRAHKIMVGRFLQCRCHMIFCLRAEEKMQLVEEKFEKRHGGEGKKIVVIPAKDRPINERWEPICEKRFMYEMTSSFILLPSQPGIGIPLKLQEQHQVCFPQGQQIGSKSGSMLANWASGGGEAAQQQSSNSGDEAAVKRAEWVDRYIAKVKDCKTLDELADLQTKQQGNLTKFRDGYPDLWEKITNAQGDAYDRLSANG